MNNPLDALAGPHAIKPRIVECLRSSGELTFNEIYDALKRHGVKATYPAAQHAADELTYDKVLTRHGTAYRINPEWARAFYAHAQLFAHDVGLKPLSRAATFTVRFSPDELYTTLVDLLSNATDIRIGERTPALFLSKEAGSSLWRGKYKSTLEERAANPKVSVKYLFASDNTLDALKTDQDRDAIARMELAAKTGKLDVRCALRNHMMSCLITPTDAIVTSPSPYDTDINGFIHLSNTDTASFARLYDNLYFSAQPLAAFIPQAKKALGGSAKKNSRR
jgi:hypothetical protein